MSLNCDGCGNTQHFIREGTITQLRRVEHDAIFYYNGQQDLIDEELLDTIEDELEEEISSNPEGDILCKNCDSSGIYDDATREWVNTGEEWIPEDESERTERINNVVRATTSTKLKYIGRIPDQFKEIIKKKGV